MSKYIPSAAFLHLSIELTTLSLVSPLSSILACCMAASGLYFPFFICQQENRTCDTLHLLCRSLDDFGISASFMAVNGPRMLESVAARSYNQRSKTSGYDSTNIWAEYRLICSLNSSAYGVDLPCNVRVSIGFENTC